MKEKILKVMNEVLEITDANEQTSQKNCENWDSLRHLNIVVALEEEFDISLEPEEISKMQDFNAISEVVKEKLQ